VRGAIFQRILAGGAALASAKHHSLAQVRALQHLAVQVDCTGGGIILEGPPDA